MPAQDRAISRRDLLWHKPEPGREVASLRERVAGADRGDDRARDDRADPRHAHEAVAACARKAQALSVRGTEPVSLL